MSPKEILFLYGRNVKGTFLSCLTQTPVDPYFEVKGYLLFFHLLLLPITLTFGAGIKTIIDVVTRKEQPPEKMAELNSKVAEVEEKKLKPLVKELLSYEPKSNSSRALKQTLTTIPQDEKSALDNDIRQKKWELQLSQLTSPEQPEPTSVYQKSYIANLELNESNIKKLELYNGERTIYYKQQAFEKQKSAVQEYLGAAKNAGKRMQNIIYFYFFPPKNTKLNTSEINKTDNVVQQSQRFNKN